MPQEGQIASAPGKPTLVYTGGKWRPQGSQSGGMTLASYAANLRRLNPNLDVILESDHVHREPRGR